MKKLIILLIINFCLINFSFAQLPFDTTYARTHYTKYDYMIPMRDGVKLFTSVYIPKDTSHDYPFMMKRTCYSVAPYGPALFPYLLGPSPEFMEEGFIFVYQDVRGKHHSEGSWEEIRPFNPDKKGKEIDEASDTYDTVDWLLKHVKHNNGKVGVWGISYPGFFATNAVLAGHPAIKAVSPQAPVTNWFLGDDTHHNGALFIMDEFNFDYDFANSTNGPTKNNMPPLDINYSDNYQFFLDSIQTVSGVNDRYWHHKVRFWDTILMHPDYDKWWQARDVSQFLYQVKPATLIVGGWYDAEDQWGTMQTYESIEQKNPQNRNSIVMGPWYHGGWASMEMDHLGDQLFGSNTSRWFQQQVEFPFFMHYLKGTSLPPLPEALLYDAGLNRWDRFDRWPSEKIIPEKIYFGEKRSLSFSAPKTTQAFDEYVSDPSAPVPYEGGIQSDRGITYLNADQRFASRRPDVLTFSTSTLDNNVTLAGTVFANLCVSVSGTDADFIVKVIDVNPDTMSSYTINGESVAAGGYQRLVRAEVMRGKYRNSFEKPEPFAPGKPTWVRFHVPDVLYTFKKGHRIMIQVQSSWFPLVDRNPQVFENIYKASPEDFKKSIIRLYHDKERPSYIELGILPAAMQEVYKATGN